MNLILVLLLSFNLTFAQTDSASKRRPFDPFNDPAPAAKPEKIAPSQMPSFGLGSLLFGNSIQGFTDMFAGGGGSNFEVNEREDDQFKYVDIKIEGVDKNNLNISVKEEMITLQGQVKKEEKEGDQVISSFTSSFMNSFSVPEGVNSTDPKFEFKDDKVIIKFKKK